MLNPWPALVHTLGLSSVSDKTALQSAVSINYVVPNEIAEHGI